MVAERIVMNVAECDVLVDEKPVVENGTVCCKNLSIVVLKLLKIGEHLAHVNETSMHLLLKP